jgi:CO/xanthine dehydrogenase FAD-binding subunit
VRVPETERCLAAGGSIEEAQRVLAGEIRPIDDVRSTAQYRLRMAGVGRDSAVCWRK